jgi:hypothetical protein
VLGHLALVVGVTVATAAGLFGLGDLLARREGATIRWVFGWSALWWIIALPSQFLGPRAGVVTGIVAVVAGVVRLFTRRRQLQRPATWGAAALAVGAPLWLVTPNFYDALVYHLGLPWSWLVNGSFAPTQHNIFSHFPLAASTVYLLPVAAGTPEAAAGLHWLTFVTALASAVALARNLGAQRWSWTAALFVFAAWHAPWLATLAAADHLVLLGILVAAEILTSPEDTGLPWLEAGVALGLSLSSKYTAIMPAAAMLGAAVVFLRPRWTAVAAGATALATSSFWWIRNVWETGNPMHPLLWGVFGGPGWTAEEYARYSRVVREGVVGPQSWFTGPVELAKPANLGLWLPLAALVSLAAIFPPRSVRAQTRWIAASALLGIASWAMTAQTARYAIPAAALVACLAAAGLARMTAGAARVAAAALGLAVLHGVWTLGFFLFGLFHIERPGWAAPRATRGRTPSSSTTLRPRTWRLERFATRRPDPDRGRRPAVFLPEAASRELPLRHAADPGDRRAVEDPRRRSPRGEGCRLLSSADQLGRAESAGRRRLRSAPLAVTGRRETFSRFRDSADGAAVGRRGAGDPPDPLIRGRLRTYNLDMRGILSLLVGALSLGVALAERPLNSHPPRPARSLPDISTP